MLESVDTKNNHFLGITNFNYDSMSYYEKNAFHEKLYSYCYGKAIRGLHNEDLAHNVAQDVSFIVVKNIYKYDPKIAKFITWIEIILKREIIKIKKHRDAQKRQIPITRILEENKDGEIVEDNRLVSEENVALEVEKKLLLLDLRNAASKLDERQRKIYYMYFVEEKTLSYIGKKVGLSHEGVRLSVEKIKKYLKNYFSQQENKIGA
jgi:RNA polymerase sigma factor (sigma-70 family)